MSAATLCPISPRAGRWSRPARSIASVCVSGVTWHDGARFTAADVKFTFEEVLLEVPRPRPKASMGGVLAGIDASDDRTVVFRFKQPYAPAASTARCRQAPIVARHVYQDSDPQTNPANAGAPSAPGRSSSSPIARARRSGWLATRLLQARLAVPRRDRRCASSRRLHPGLALENGEVDFLWGVPGPQQSRLAGRQSVPHGADVLPPAAAPNCITDGQLQPRPPDPQRRAGRRANRAGTRSRGVPAPDSLSARAGERQRRSRARSSGPTLADWLLPAASTAPRPSDCWRPQAGRKSAKARVLLAA